MSLTIYKTPLKIQSEQIIDVPGGAELLCAREQRDELCVWYRCNPANVLETPGRLIRIVGTGHADAPDAENSKYLGTAMLANGELVLHVFEIQRG